MPDLLLSIAMVLCACEPAQQDAYAPQFGKAPPSAVREYVFGVHPLHNPERLHEMFGPIMDYLGAHIVGASFRLEASRSYAAFDEKLYRRVYEFALPNPYQTVNALQHGYRVFGKMADDENFRGIILVRRDGRIKNVTDLKGLSVSFPAPTALAATMLPQYHLKIHGLDVMRDVDVRYVGSQESSIMSVFLGNVAAGATWPPPWRSFSRERPEVAAELRVIGETDSLPNNGLIVRDDVSPDVAAQVEKLLLSLHEQPEGKAWLERLSLSRFEAATADTYRPVQDFLQRFGQTVRRFDEP